MKPTYEPGMRITYDATSKRVVVAFRGRISVLPETYESEDKGTAAGEGFCRHQGWKPQDQDKRDRKFRSMW